MGTDLMVFVFFGCGGIFGRIAAGHALSEKNCLLIFDGFVL